MKRHYRDTSEMSLKTVVASNINDFLFESRVFPSVPPYVRNNKKGCLVIGFTLFCVIFIIVKRLLGRLLGYCSLCFIPQRYCIKSKK